MNIETGEIRDFTELTDDDKASGKWTALAREQVQRLAQIETERLARRNKGVDTAMVQARLDRAEAKRLRRAGLRHTPTGRDDTQKASER